MEGVLKIPPNGFLKIFNDETQRFFQKILFSALFVGVVFPLSAAVITVSNTNDSGPGSLREAVAMALSNADPNDQIVFGAGTNGTPIGLTFAEIPINLGVGESLTITGNGVGTTTIDSEGTGRIFNISGGVLVSISNLTLTGAQNGGTSLITGNGGAILTSTDLQITDVTFSNNNARAGAGIYNDGATVLVSNSTFTNNEAFGFMASGGGLYNDGVLEITNSNVSNNLAKRAGGGIEGAAGSTTTLVNVTVNDNSLIPFPAPGNGGGIHISGNGNINITGGTINGNTADVQGGGLWNGTGTMTIDGTTIEGNVSLGNALGEGAGGIYNAGGTLDISNATLTNNLANSGFGTGGGIWNAGGILMVTNTTVQGNSCNRAGGGIEASGNSSNILNNIIVIDNTAGGTPPNDAPGNGGGIHISDGGTTTISNSTVQGNTAKKEGGGLWNDAGLLTISNSTISNNIAEGDAADDGGGGIFNNGGIANLNSVTIEDNNAIGTSGSGGGILNLGGTVSATLCVINGNFSERAGGGIEATAGSTTTLSETNLDSNSTGNNPGNGGGMHLTGNANATFTNGLVEGNTAANEGGGLWNGTGTLTITGTSIIDNTASGDAPDNGGGGLFNAGGVVDATNAIFTQNTANGTSGSGGGVFNDAMGIIGLNACIISDNSANRAGGGLEATSGTTTNLIDTDLTSNGTSLSGTANPGNGGGLHVTGDGAVNMTNGLVDANFAASEGGGLWNGTGSMFLENVTISNNTANGDDPDNGGGGLFNAGGAVNMLGGTFNNNTANGVAGSGGGILNDSGGSLVVDGTVFQGNSANRAGGGIEVTGATVNSLLNITLSMNLAGVAPAIANPGNGGGLHVTGNGDVTLQGATLDQNEAALEGGGAWNGNGTMTLDGCTVDGNQAHGNGPENGGGGLFNSGGILNLINNTLVTNNLADGTAGSGGGILNLGGALNADNSTISGNVSVRAGGGIEATAGSTNNLSNTSLDNNTTSGNPGNGGGMHITGAGDAFIFGGTINNNTAGNDGGGLWNGSGLMDLEGTTVDGNLANGAAANNGGGGIFNHSGTVNIFMVTLSNNTAAGIAGSGGGILNNDDATLMVNQTTIASNSANRAGGGIEARGGSSTTLTQVTLDANDAGTNPGNGGGMHVTSDGNTMITGSNIANNLAAHEGGGLWNGTGTMEIASTTLENNTASGAAADNGGGGIFNAGGMINASGLTIINNAANGAAGSGGGILNDGGVISIQTSEISGNTSNRAGGGIEVTSGTVNSLTLTQITNNSTGLAPGNGGGLHVTGVAITTLTQTTVAGNSAGNEGGGLWAAGGGEMNVVATTVSQNSAPVGGGLFVEAGGGVVNLSNSTLSGNLATNGGGINGGAGSTVNLISSTVASNSASNSGGGIDAAAISLNAESALIGDNLAPAGADVNGPFTTVTNSLVENPSGPLGITNGVDGNILEYDPQLGPLFNNGGPTKTHALSGSSPALDRGNSNLTDDQRGFARVVGGVSDMGAFELGAANLTNDLCANAITLTCADLLYGTLGTATAADAPTACDPNNSGGNPGVWYRVTGTGERITISTEFLTNFDSEINVYSGSCNALVCVGGDDDSALNNTSTFTFDSQMGVEYFIYVSGEAGVSGQFQIGYDAELKIFCPPTVQTNADPDICGALEPLLDPITIEGNCIVGTVSDDAPGFFPVGTTLVTYTVTSNMPGILTQTCTQEVIIVDQEAPEIICPGSTVLETSWINCGYPTYVLPQPVATDECSAVVIDPDPANPAGILSPGQYMLNYTATDTDGNQSSCTHWVEILDTTFPLLQSCPDDLTAIAQSADGAVVSWSEPTAIDNCTGEIYLSSNYNPGDLFDVGNTEVMYTLTDPNGNGIECNFTVTVVPNSPNVAVHIGGLIATEELNGVQEVEVQLNGDMSDMMLTGSDGLFDVEVPVGGDFTLSPEKNTEILNGVSTYDLVLINKHILNIEPLDSPYKLIAADVNNSGSITALDLVHLRKVILLISDEFPNNTSWRFVSSAYEFNDPTNPLGEPFSTLINVNNVNQSISDADFVAIKIGDINLDAVANENDLLGVDDRNGESLAISLDNRLVKEGEKVTVDFSAQDLNHFGYQFALSFEGLEFLELIEGQAGMENFGLHWTDDHLLTASWHNPMAKKLVGETLFSISFKAKKAGWLSDFLKLQDAVLRSEAYAASGALQEVRLNFAGELASGMELFQNYPNPFHEETTISFFLPKAESGKLTITDVNGNVVQAIRAEFKHGWNSIPFNYYGGSSFLFYELKTESFHEVKRMVTLE